jgi:hypothetical protein
MRNKQVVFLSTERAWKRWVNTVVGPSYVATPTQYPCWAYARVQDYGYEDGDQEYLYREDLIKMLTKIDDTYARTARRREELVRRQRLG